MYVVLNYLQINTSNFIKNKIIYKGNCYILKTQKFITVIKFIKIKLYVLHN